MSTFESLNEQIAHDLAVAKMSSKQLSISQTIDEYEKLYSQILEELNRRPVKQANCESFEKPF